MLRQKTARPKNFREVQKSIDLGVSALGLDLPRRAGESERRRRSAASQVHGWLSRCMQSLRLARGQEAAQEQRAQGARVDDVACGVASVASCAVSTTGAQRRHQHSKQHRHRHWHKRRHPHLQPP